MSHLKKGTAAILAGVLSVSCVVPAFAAAPSDVENYDHVTTAGNKGNAAVTLTVEDREQPVIFSAYVPAELPIAIDVNGDVVLPENAKIINGVENLPIEVEAIDVTMEDGWKLASMDTDMSLETKDTKKIAMEVLGQDLSDADSFSPAKIEANGDIALNMKANLPDQSASSQTKIATIGFTMNWWEENQLNATHLLSVDRIRNSVLYNITGSIVFSTEGYDPEQHTGTAIDISEAQDRSVMAVVNGQNAVVYSEGGTLAPENCSSLFASFKESHLDLHGLDTSNVKNMSYLFADNVNLTDLDISNLNTENVLNFQYMFDDCTALQTLNLQNFDTKKATNMYAMFLRCSKLTTIDLSSFDTTNATNTNRMFENCSAATVYCRTNTDAIKMKNSSNCPATINFIVKE